MLYSKNGSIPKPQTDGTDGWIEVSSPPTPGPGQETIWWYPPGWLVRPIQPAPVENHVWNWSQSTQSWVSCQISTLSVSDTPPLTPPSLPSGNVSI